MPPWSTTYAGLLAAGHHQTLTYGPDGERRGEGMRVFVWAFAPPPRMLVFGAIDFAAAVARIGNFLGYHVTVCDARPVFATNSRFPAADEVVVQWPHKFLKAEAEAGRIDRRTVLCVLTHDPKFDVPLLEVALRLPEVGYVGAMGSRRTHDDRLQAARGGRADRGGARPALLADRPRPGRPYPRGDRGQHRRRDHRAPVGRPRRAAHRPRRPDPPLSGPFGPCSGPIRSVTVTEPAPRRGVMTGSRSELHSRRLDAVRAWTAFVEHGDRAEALVRAEIIGSWERSGTAVPLDVAEAPLADESDTAASWNGSPLQVAVSRIEQELRRTAEDGDLVVAITDAQTRILWTYGGRVMRRKAETVNFVPGGRWDENSVGTNALDLAGRTGKASMVFSAEHFAPIVHNWVCWAAPLHDPVTGEQLGVIDLSTTWDRTHPIGLATARVMARLIETAMPHSRSLDGSAEPARTTPGSC